MKGFPGFDSLTAGQKVRVYMGWGWANAAVVSTSDESALLQLASDGRRIRCYDPRNLRHP